MSEPIIVARLEELRAEIHAQRISWGELSELQTLAEQLDVSRLDELEWAGVPEHPEETHEWPLRLDLTPTQIRAVLDVIGPVVADTTGPLEEAERELDGTLLNHETKREAL